MTTISHPAVVDHANSVELECIVKGIRYKSDSPDNDFAILRVGVDKSKYPHAPIDKKTGQVIVCGNLSNIEVGETLKIYGIVQKHPKFGMQIKATGFEMLQPRTFEEVKEYLKGCIHQIGPVMAKRIVDHFGVDTLDIIDENPAKLREVKGVDKKRIEYTIKRWQETRRFRKIHMFLTRIGLNANRHTATLIDKYGDNVPSIISEDPYRIARDISGFGFVKADQIAQKLNIPEVSPVRITAAIEHVIREKMNTVGDCFQYVEDILLDTEKLLNHPDIIQLTIKTVLDQVLEDGEILIAEENRVYLPYIHRMELYVATKLNELLKGPMPTVLSMKEPIDTLMKVAEKKSDVGLSDDQKQAIRRSITSKVSVITGGPGCGKTTILKALVGIFHHLTFDVKLMAPTGKSANRMTELIEQKAWTIHKYLAQIDKAIKSGADLQEMMFRDCVIIIDELSMVYLHLLQRLLMYCDNSVVLVFVGDQDQLPSIGAGAILRDMISSESIPCTRLTKIFRQAQMSHIITSAHRINNGEMPEINRIGKDFAMPKTDMFFVIDDYEEKLAQAVIYCATTFAKYLGFDPLNDCQILSPMYRGPVGVSNLNTTVQKTINPNPADKITFNYANDPVVWGLGDKLMFLTNDYDLELFNGDLGILHAITREGKGKIKSLIFKCNGTETEIIQDKFRHLTLAYANTIHKFQGSQCPMIVIALHQAHWILLQRQLLYTAITRTQKACVLCCSDKALTQAIRNNKIAKRNTFLAERIKELANGSGS